MVELGLTLEFHTSPPNHYVQRPVSRHHVKKQLMDDEIRHILDIRAIEPVPENEKRMGFYSILILVPKSSGGWRGILNLKQLNYYTLYR